MEHKEFKRIVEGSKTAIVFIHGIAGTPNHFNDFVALLPENISVYNLLLDGHGKEVRDFSKTSMNKWENQVEATINELSLTYAQIFIVAHSMGTLFAIEQAIKNNKIEKLFLLAVPIKLFLKPKMLSNSLKVYFDKIKPNDKVAIAAKNCYGIKQSKNILDYLGWVPRYLELFAKIRQTRKILGFLNTPCCAFQSSKDEMVSIKSIQYLKQNSSITVTELKNSSHYFYDKNDYKMLMREFEKFIPN